jgi:hypothetical protein
LLAIGSTVIGGSVAINGGRDMLVSGRFIVADEGIGFSAGRDLSVVNAQNSEQSSSSSKKSGLVGGESMGKVKSAQHNTLEQVPQAGSQIASLGGNVTLSAGNQYTQASSEVMAPEGDIDIRGKDMLINAASDTSHGTKHSKYSKTEPGVNVSISLGSSKSESSVERTTQSAVGLTVGRGQCQRCRYGGVDSNLTADNKVDLMAAESTASQHSRNKSSGSCIGVGFGIGGASNGFTIDLAVNETHGNAGGEDVSYTNTTSTAART